jgi:hypothetical protein
VIAAHNPRLSLLAAEFAAAEPRQQAVTDWPARIGWVVGLLLFIALLYWLMRQGWKWRGTLQGDLPEPPPLPEDGPGDGPGEPLLEASGRYHGSTTAGQWLDRIVAHGLGTRSRAALTLTGAGVAVRRPGARDFFIPAGKLCGARTDKGIAGKVLTEGGLLVITWRLGERRVDSGFRLDRSADHPEWVRRLEARIAAQTEALTPAGGAAPGPHHPGATPENPERDT